MGKRSILQETTFYSDIFGVYIKSNCRIFPCVWSAYLSIYVQVTLGLGSRGSNDICLHADTHPVNVSINVEQVVIYYST